VNATVITDRICQLMKSESEALGFVPKPRVREHVIRGLYKLQISQSEIVGYMIHGPLRETISVHQVCVDLALRRLQHAYSMESQLVLEAVEARSTCISLACRASLESNLFWIAAGYRNQGEEPGGIKRRTIKRRWMKTIDEEAAKRAVLQLAGELGLWQNSKPTYSTLSAGQLRAISGRSPCTRPDEEH